MYENIKHKAYKCSCYHQLFLCMCVCVCAALTLSTLSVPSSKCNSSQRYPYSSLCQFWEFRGTSRQYHLFSSPVCLVMHWHYKRKLDSDYCWEFKGVTIKPKEEICAVIYNKTNNLDIKLVFLSFKICNMFSVKEGPSFAFCIQVYLCKL